MYFIYKKGSIFLFHLFKTFKGKVKNKNGL